MGSNRIGENQSQQQERSFELRSEKVRSIVGQIPSSIVRYGIMIIGIVLLFLFSIGYFLPYKQVYVGVATLHEVKTIVPTDSVDITILLTFDTKRPNRIEQQSIFLQSPKMICAGKIIYLSSVRDTLKRQEAIAHFRYIDIKLLENQTVDFKLVRESGSLFQSILGNLGFQ